jgi:hypothetical protein
VLIAAAVIAAGCGTKASGGGGNSKVADAAVEAKGLDFVPQDALLYVVLDADLEGDNWDKVDSQLKNFDKYPGRDKWITDAFKDADQDIDYKKDIEPWLGDTAGAAVMSLDGGPNGDGETIAWADLRDEAKAKKFIDDHTDKKGDSKVEGTTVTESVAKGSDGDSAYWAIKNKVVVIASSKDAIESALKTEKSGDTIADSDDIKDVAKQVGDDTVGAIVLSGRGVRDMLEQGDSSSGDSGEMDTTSDTTMSSQLEGDDESMDAGDSDSDSDSDTSSDSGSMMDGTGGVGAKLKGAAPPGLKDLPQIQALRGVSIGIEVEDHGMRLHGYAGYDKDKLDDTGLGDNTKPELIESLPGDTIAAMGGNDIGGILQSAVKAMGDDFETQIAGLEGVLDLKVDDIANAYNGQWAAAVGGKAEGASPIPAGTIAIQTDDEDSATEVTNKLMAATSMQTQSPPSEVKVGGHDALEANLGVAALTGTTFDKTSIFTTSHSVIENWGEGETLGGNDAYTQVRKDADAPDEVVGMFFVDTPKVLDLAGGLGGSSVPDDAKSVGPILGWVESGDDNQTFDLFVTIEDGSDN